MQNYKICPYCGEVLRSSAIVCTYCRQKVNKVNPLVDIFDVGNPEKNSAKNKNAKSRTTFPAKSVKKQGKTLPAEKDAKRQIPTFWNNIQKAHADQKSSSREDASRADRQNRANWQNQADWQNRADWQNQTDRKNQIWSENQKKTWEEKKNNTQSNGYGKQRTAAPKSAHSTGHYSGKNDNSQRKKKKWIIALVIIFIILTEIPWSSLGRSFYRFGFYLKQEAEHLQQMFGLEDSTNKSRGNSSDDTASGIDTDNAFVLKPDSMYENGYNLSSVLIFAPDGYNLSWMADDQSLLWINTKPYDSYDSLDLYGEAYLIPNTDETKESCNTNFDDLQNDGEYTNVVITKDQQCMTNAGIVSYVTAGYNCTTGNSEQTYNNCLCWLEYDDNTLLVLDLIHNETDKSLPDIISEIFAGVQT